MADIMTLFTEWRELTHKLDAAAEPIMGSAAYDRLIEVEALALAQTPRSAGDMAALVVMCCDWPLPGAAGQAPAGNSLDVQLARKAHAILGLESWPDTALGAAWGPRREVASIPMSEGPTAEAHQGN